MKNKAIVSGVIVPVITPVDNNECVDEKAFRQVIRRCLHAGVSGIFVGGSAGMGPLLSESQWKRTINIARDEVDDTHFLLGGAIATSTAIAIERIKFLEAMGYNHVVVTPTYYISLCYDHQFLKHFGECRQATDINMIIYNIPSCTNSRIPIKVLEYMANLGWYKTIKESSGDKKYFEQAMELAITYNLSLLQGNEPDIEWGLNLGAGGIVPVCANYEPSTFVAAINASQNGDRQLLQRIQGRINHIRDILLVKPENWIAGIMYGLCSLGIGNGIPVRPILEISIDAKKRIDMLDIWADKNTIQQVG